MTDSPGQPPAQAENIDWEAIERSDAFQELVRKRKAFVLPGTNQSLAEMIAGAITQQIGETVTL